MKTKTIIPVERKFKQFGAQEFFRVRLEELGDLQQMKIEAPLKCQSRPYLSIVATSRNDNHGGDLLNRMQLFVDGILTQTEKFELPTELVLVEWNPPIKHPLLSDVLRWEIQNEFCTIRIIEVPSQIHRRYKHSANMPLYQMIAKNVGIRRARGRFVLATNIDILFSNELFAFLASDKMTEGKIYRANRLDVKEDAPEDLSIDELLSFCRHNIIRINDKYGSLNLNTGSYHQVYPPDCENNLTFLETIGGVALHTNACGDFQLMARKHWIEIHGYPELDMFSFHLDSLLEYMAHFNGIAEETLPEKMGIFHIEHTSGWSPEIHKKKTMDKKLETENIPRLSNEKLYSLSAEMANGMQLEIFNDDNWGLGSDSLNESIVLRAKWESKFPSDKGSLSKQAEPGRGLNIFNDYSIVKYLSIVVTARNDNHGGNMLHRMQSFVNGLFSQCQKYNIDAELIIVEWNPPQNKKRISEVIEWPKFPSPLTVRIIEVSPAIHCRFRNSDKIPLFQMIAKNVGIQRARGKFVLTTCIDILFSDDLMWYLSRKQLDEDCFYRICRYDVGSKVIPTDASIEKQLEFCSQNLVRVQGLNGTEETRGKEIKISSARESRNFFNLSEKKIATLLKKESQGKNLFTNACGDFTMMARDKWLFLRGYPELPKWSIYLDGLLLHMAHVSGLQQIILPDPMRIYHIEHDMGWAVTQAPITERPSLDYEKEYLPWCRKMLREKRPLNPNNEFWGLAKEDLREITITREGKGFQDLDKKIFAPGSQLTEKPGDILTTFQKWIEKLGAAQNQLYYRDQTPRSLSHLLEIAQHHKPAKIIELGTLSGLSLRAWLLADVDAEICAVDLSFEALYNSKKLLPLDTSDVKLVESDILDVDFSQLWDKDETVLLFVDAHDLPGVPIMEYVLNEAIPKLSPNSIIIVDDIWYNAEKLTDDTDRQFFEDTVLKQIDHLQCFEGFYAPYWEGGSFFGFREVMPLMAWVNRNRVKLMVPTGIKSIAFKPPARNCLTSKHDHQNLSPYIGRIKYNPIETICRDIGRNKSLPAELLRKIQKGIKHYADCELDLALNSFQNITTDETLEADFRHVQAVILSRLGKFADAQKALTEGIQNHKLSSEGRQLLSDIQKMRRLPPSLKENQSANKASINPITIFTVPKPFKGHNDIIQRNAIQSWTLIEPRPEIILIGNEPGTDAVAKQYSLKHISHVNCNEYGTPLLDSIIQIARSNSENDVMMYINTDIILSGEVSSAVETAKQRFDSFLIIGQRWDVDIVDPFPKKAADIAFDIQSIGDYNGRLHSPSGIDYFIYQKNPWGDIPPFALGRTAWDGWLVFQALASKVPVIDATETILAIHQNHDYKHARGGYKGAWGGPEAIQNQKLSDGYKSVRSVADASWRMINGELERSHCNLPDLAKNQQTPHDFAQRLYLQSISFLKEHSFERAISCLEEAQRNNGTIEGYSKILELAQRGQQLTKSMRPLGN